MSRSLTIGLTAAVAVSMSQPRLQDRKLADIAVVGLPSALKGPDNPQPSTADPGRLQWTFSERYLWASMGSVPRYKQRIAVALIAPDASARELENLPYATDVSYAERKEIRHELVGTGTLTVWECIYEVVQKREKAYAYFFMDRSKRLALAWHAVAKEVELGVALAQIPRIAASFRLTRDPVSTFADMRDAPRRDTESRATKRTAVQAMFRREGHPTLIPGKAVLHQGALLEWMATPEPRYQLVVPLGKVRATSSAAVVGRPRPLRSPEYERLPGTVGWRESADGAWLFSNNDNDYLPLPGIAGELSAQQQDSGYVYFYYIATVRVEEEEDDTRLTSLDWFFDSIPEVRQRWREGSLVGPGKPEPDRGHQ